MPVGGPLPGAALSDAVDSVAHVVQVALTPVFLLSGIGTLLNLFNTRLSRVSDHREHIDELLHSDAEDLDRIRLGAHLVRLRHRTMVLDSAMILGGTGGASTCGAALVLFLGSLRNNVIATWLFVLLGLALGCTAFALVMFLVDSILAWHGLRQEGPLPRPK